MDDKNVPFLDRESAAVLLAEKIKKQITQSVLVLAIPRGGAVTGKIIAGILKAEFDLLICKKVGHPANPEYAIGSVCADGSSVQTDKGSRQLADYFDKESVKLASRLKERYSQLTNRSEPIPVQDRDVLLCDDGVATGSTILAAVKSLQKSKAGRIYIATPVISQLALNKLKKTCDQVFYLDAPHPFGAVGEFYVSFPTINDDDVRRMMKK